MKDLKILVAPWGWPQVYKNVTYKVERRNVESKTATGALKEVLKPNHTILIFPDSLAIYNSKTFELKHYKDIVVNLKEFLVENFLKDSSWLSEYSRSYDEILISPNVGTFIYKERINSQWIEKARLSIKGKMRDYFPWIYYHLSSIIFGKIIKGSRDIKKVTIVLDTSHGINYMSTLTYLALFEIGSLIEIKLHNEVELKLYNADPFAEKVDFLEVNLVRDEIPKIQLSRRVPTNKFIPLKTNGRLPELSRSIQKKFGEFEKVYKNDCLPFLGAFYQGIPLGLFTFIPSNLERLNDIIEMTIMEFNNHIRVIPQGEDNFLVIKRNLGFTEYLNALLLIRNLATVLTNIGVKRLKEIDLGELKKVGQKIYKNFPTITGRINYEINHLEKKELKNCEEVNTWTTYGTCAKPIDKRNFFAHAGLCGNSFKYIFKKGKCLVAYCEEQIEKIKDYLVETMRF